MDAADQEVLRHDGAARLLPRSALPRSDAVLFAMLREDRRRVIGVHSRCTRKDDGRGDAGAEERPFWSA